jgi:hypothetical protein
MTDTSNTSRRTVLFGGLAALGVALAAAFAFKAKMLFGPHYPATPYDDLLSRLPDRENAARLGAAVLKQAPTFDAHDVAAPMRARLGGRALADVLTEDLQQHHIVEVHGWVLPETLTTLCALAAMATLTA